MLDINYIRANQSKVEDAIRNKGYGDEIDLGEILKLDDERKKLAMEADKLRHDRNEISAKMKNGKPDAALIEQGKELKKQLAEIEPKLTEVEASFISKLKTVPNIPEDDVPVGLSEDDNEVAEVCGELHATHALGTRSGTWLARQGTRRQGYWLSFRLH